MSEPIYPGAVWDPGRNAGYMAGRTRMDVAVAHFTVGVHSEAIGRRGFFTWLIGRDGLVTQFAEADALTWHAGEWNVYGPGIEVEYYSEVDGDTVFTDAALGATSGLIHWLNAEWGIPLTYYDGPRQSPSDQRGFMSHRSLVQTEQHYDYWPQSDWDAMVAPPTPEVHFDMATLLRVPGGGGHYFDGPVYAYFGEDQALANLVADPRVIVIDTSTVHPAAGDVVAVARQNQAGGGAITLTGKTGRNTVLNGTVG